MALDTDTQNEVSLLSILLASTRQRNRALLGEVIKPHEALRKNTNSLGTIFQRPLPNMRRSQIVLRASCPLRHASMTSCRFELQ